MGRGQQRGPDARTGIVTESIKMVIRKKHDNSGISNL